MEKIKSAVVLAIIALSAAMFSANAQDIPTATLQSGDQVQIFKGANALKNAHAAAQSGDIISLSAGTFNSTDITKAVKIRGVGYGDNENGTTLVNAFTINIPEGESGLQMEGMIIRANTVVNGQLKNALFRHIKERDSGTFNLTNSTTSNCTFSECRLNAIILDSNSDNLLIDHCWVMRLYRDGTQSSSAVVSVVNSVIDNLLSYLSSNSPKLQYANITNSIIRESASNSVGIVWNYCIWSPVQEGIVYYNPGGTQTNLIHLSQDELKALFSEKGLFTLTDEAAAKYLGTDGKQIGLYGGEVPYSEKPYVPVITKFEVPSTVAADGKLSVTVAAETR